MEEDDGAPSGRSSPPTPKKIKMESEESTELLKVEDHFEDESEEIEADDEEEDGDGSPQLPPLLDMIDLPPSSPLPPTPPLPSSPRDSNMEQQDSEDEGPPPGWGNPYQLQEQVEQMLTFAASLIAIPSDRKMENVEEDACNGDGRAPELVVSDNKVEEQVSEDEGPPPGWDAKCQSEPELQVACPTISQPDIKMEEQESEDEGPPPGWDSKCHPEEPELQTPCPTITQSDMKTEEVQQDARNGEGPTPALVPSDKRVEEHEQDSEDEGPPPGWDAKCHPEPESTISQSDIKTEDIQQDARNRDDLQPSSDHSPTPQVVPSSDIKMEEHDSEDEGPPPGWDAKFQPSECKIEDEGPPPPSGGATARMECEEQKKVEAFSVERSQPTPTKHQSLPPTPVKPPLPLNNPEMGQMVCGSCRRLLSYPKCARFVECGCCLEENYVLQEDEVGQVICGGCDVLLMYPYGAPKVRCVNCSTETEIGDQNRRPPLSQQQQRARRHLKRVQTNKC